MRLKNIEKMVRELRTIDVGTPGKLYHRGLLKEGRKIRGSGFRANRSWVVEEDLGGGLMIWSSVEGGTLHRVNVHTLLEIVSVSTPEQEEDELWE